MQEQSTHPVHAVIAAGGTSGHFFPALAIARALGSKGARVTFLVAGHHAAAHLELAAKSGFAACSVPAPRIRLGTPRAMARTLLGLWRGRAAARAHLRRLAPEVVIGMGSYASVPAGLAAVSLKIPLVLHEGNTVIGRANRLLSRWARALAVSLPPAPGRKPGCRTVLTGLPLRPELLEAAARPSPAPAALFAEGEWGLAPGAPLILVFGGSQGAAFLNRTVPAALAAGAERGLRFQVLHLTGTTENSEIEAAYQRAGIPCCVRARETRMHLAYRAAALAITRAGAGTVTELALFARPALLVPLPAATDDHQTANARLLAGRGAAALIPEGPAAQQRIEQTLEEWLGRGVLREKQERALGLRDLAVVDAAERVAELALSCGAPARP